MRVLLDTNILIHREAAVVVRDDIGVVFGWLDQLGYEKWVHPVSKEEIEKHENERVRRSFSAKLAAYRLIQNPAVISLAVQKVSDSMDTTDNDRNDTIILNELYSDRVDILITEDRKINRKGSALGLDGRIFTIDAFLEKVTAENPTLANYQVLSVRKVSFGEIDVSDQFFDGFRAEYPGFDSWFNKKSEEPAYVCWEGQKVVAFLYLKVEDEREPYPTITPPFMPNRRLKIGTLKVAMNGYKLGERFLKIVFDNAIRQRVSEVYVTVFTGSPDRDRLVNLLEDFGFELYGKKQNDYGVENVYVRDMTPDFNSVQPSLTFPYISRSSSHFLVPIYPDYHTELLPDSILNTESPADFVEQEPHRNAIRKVYVSRSYSRDLLPGDTIVFYRTGGYYLSVVTTIGVVEGVHLSISSEEEFIRLCRKRSVYSDDKLRQFWNYRPYNRPFVVDFLYTYSFPKRPNMKSLIDNGVIKDKDSAPRGFERINIEQFNTIIRLSETDQSVIID